MDFPKNRRGWWVDSLKIIVVCLPNPSDFFCLFWPEFDPTHNEKAVAKSNQNRRRLGAQPQRF